MDSSITVLCPHLLTKDANNVCTSDSGIQEEYEETGCSGHQNSLETKSEEAEKLVQIQSSNISLIMLNKII